MPIAYHDVNKIKLINNLTFIISVTSVFDFIVGEIIKNTYYIPTTST